MFTTITSPSLTKEVPLLSGVEEEGAGEYYEENGVPVSNYTGPPRGAS